MNRELSDALRDADPDRIDQAVLALLLLGHHDGGRVWKSHDWSAMERLHERGLVTDPRGKAKSVAMTQEGLAEALAAFKTLFGRGDA